jgi:hypothetical protein
MLKLGGSDYQGWCVDSPSAGGIGHRYDAANINQTAEEIFKRRQVRIRGSFSKRTEINAFAKLPLKIKALRFLLQR